MYYDLIVFSAGLLLLVLGSEKMVAKSVLIAREHHISPFIIGTFLVGFGTSVPELVVTIFSVLYNSVHLSVGNALGSYICNIGLILGLTAIVRPVAIPISTLYKELPLLFISLIITILLVMDGKLTTIDSYILLALFLTFSLIVVADSGHRENVDALPAPDRRQTIYQLVGFFFYLAILLTGSHLMVTSAQNLAKMLGISELIIGLTVMSIGTSLPELATAVSSTLQGESDLCLGNIVGSNIFCLLGILPIPAVMRVDHIATENLWREFAVMIFITMLFWIFAAKFDEKKQISRLEGCFLLASYLGYIASLYL